MVTGWYNKNCFWLYLVINQIYFSATVNVKLAETLEEKCEHPQDLYYTDVYSVAEYQYFSWEQIENSNIPFLDPYFKLGEKKQLL